MNGLKVLISPLSWGFGHAGRMIPLAMELERRGCEIVFAADEPLAEMIARELPGVRMVEIPGLRIRYSRFLPQYLSIFLQLPVIVASAVREHAVLRRLAEDLGPAVIISDNRFGFYHKKIFSVYVTHQVRIAFPGFLRFLEPLASWIHRRIIERYDLCLVPDYRGSENLSGRLSHGIRLPANVAFIGPLSRFGLTGHEPFPPCRAKSKPSPDDSEEPGTTLIQPYACLILSGPEPQRSLLLRKISGSLREFPLAVLSATSVSMPLPSGRAVTFITGADTATMRQFICGASLIIARAGYTSVMELVSLGRGAVLIPTPGQTEQEYLGRYLDGRYGFITMKQNRLERLASIILPEHKKE